MLSNITTLADLRALPIGTTFDYRNPASRETLPRWWDYVIESDGIRERPHATTEQVGERFYSWEHIERNRLFQRFEDVVIDTIVGAPEPESVTIPRAEYERLQADATREFSRYDERLRPMFVNAARVATAADFCTEYDRIAGAVGAPSRDELFVKQYNHCVVVTVEFHIEATGDEDPDWTDAEILEMVNSQFGTNIGDGDTNEIRWDLSESEPIGYLDPETGETYES